MVDAESGDILSEYVASEGMHLVQINDKENGKSNSAEDKGKKIARVLDERLDMSGFDGLGASQDSYANAEVIFTHLQSTNKICHVIFSSP